jgi:hypothetical protein
MADEQAGRIVPDGKPAFSTSSTPSGSKIPKVDIGVGGNAGGIRANPNDKAPSGRRVPDWRS